MKSEHIYEPLKPGEIQILRRDGRSITYAVNKDGGLTIERALVPPRVVRKPVTPPGFVMGIAAEPILRGAVVDLDASSGMIRNASSDPEPESEQDTKEEKFDEYNGDPRDFSGYFNYIQRKRERKEHEESDQEESRAKKLVDEWRKKCEDCKNESDVWPGYLSVGIYGL